jgi:SAM-dependent methyltransferase
MPDKQAEAAQLLPQDNPLPPIWGEAAANSTLDIIVFSKDRACQLDALLRSMRAFMLFPHRIHVIYTTSDKKFELGYDLLRRWNKGVHWVGDGGVFGQATRKLVAEISRGPGRYLMWLVDDMMFTRPFTAAGLMEELDREEDIIAVSLRLGENITYCYVRDSDTTPPDFSNGHRWAWKTASRGYWHYPMSLDGNIFRTADYARLIPKLNFKNPNTLEANQSGRPFPRPDMICEPNPCVINIAWNRVQATFENRCGNVTAQYLNEVFMQGQAIDVRPFTGQVYDSCHIDIEVPLIADHRPRKPPQPPLVRRDGKSFKHIDLREIPCFVINCREDVEKRLFMQEQLTELGLDFEFIEGIRATPGWIGVALAHLRVLRQSRAQPPFLVLEDDCLFNDRFRPVLDVPAEAGALYLGVSGFGLEETGRISWGKANATQWQSHDDDYLRVFNMLARHAVLYLDEDFCRLVIESQVESLTNRHFSHPGDIGMAQLQASQLVLAVRHSMCRQTARSITAFDLPDKLPKNEIKAAGDAPARDLPGPDDNRTSKPAGAGAAVPELKNAGLCLVSHKHRFIYFPIAKNASSSLKSEFSKPRYGTEEIKACKLDADSFRDYFTFTFLRDPLSRVTSAYQEISLRIEMNDSKTPSMAFSEMADSSERFEAFLEQLRTNHWDPHVKPQRDFTGGLELDFWGRTESLQDDLDQVFDKLGLGPCPVLPERRSRAQRKRIHGYDRYLIQPENLPAHLISLIRGIYRKDIELIEAHCPEPPLQAEPRTDVGELLELYRTINEAFDDCVVFSMGKRGFYAEFSSVARAMIYALANKRQFLLDSKSFAWSVENGWADYFEPFCLTPDNVNPSRIKERISFADRESFRRVNRFEPNRLRLGQLRLEGNHDILGFFMKMIFRPVAACRDRIDAMLAGLSLPDDLDVIHIRRGDKIGSEDLLFPAADYLEVLKPIPNEYCLFVMTDDYAAVREVRQCLRQANGHPRGKNGRIRVLTLCRPGQAGFDVGMLRRKERFMAGGAATENGAGTAGKPGYREYLQDQVITLLAETTVALRARHFVSTKGSNVGWIVWRLHPEPEWCRLLQASSLDTRQLNESTWAPEKYMAELCLRDGRLHRLELPAESPVLEELQLLAAGNDPTEKPQPARMVQLPMDGGRSALAFSSGDLSSLRLIPEAEPPIFKPKRRLPPAEHKKKTVAKKKLGKRGRQDSHPAMNIEEGHLGGYLRSRHPQSKRLGLEHGDPATWTPELWQWAHDELKVRSVLDLGCGEGHAAGFFKEMGCRVLGVDGSVQAEKDSMIPGLHLRHDYANGPFIPDGRYDMVWCCEFVEHVEERFTQNFLASFASAGKYILMTFAGPGKPGWHHVNCQPRRYWINKVERLGYRHDEVLSKRARQKAGRGHFSRTGLVFVRDGQSADAATQETAENQSANDQSVPTERQPDHDPTRPLAVNDMEIVNIDGREFLLFLDIFVHPSRNKIVAVAPYYNEDWNPLSHGVDFDKVDLVADKIKVRGRYIPHRLDSWEPCILLDFEAPELEPLLRESDEISFTIKAGPHAKSFTLTTFPEPAHNVAMSLVVKNENRWIRYFLDYYLDCLEAGHVFVYDNGTKDREALLGILEPYLEAGSVTYIPWAYRWRNINSPRKMIAQPQQESHSLNRFANCEWIGFLDVDEFLRLPGRTLPSFLGGYAMADVDGLSFGLRWFHYKGVLDFGELLNPPLTFLHQSRDELGRKRQKLFVRPRNVRFLRLHNLEEGKRELQVDDSDIFFHHYCQREYRFDEGGKTKTVRDDYMLRFAGRLEAGKNAPGRRERPQTQAQWIRHITRAIAMAEAGLSGLTGEALSVEGMCGTITRHFYNNLCDFKGCRILEIGNFKGASTVAAAFENDASVTCIDNFSHFRGARDVFETNIRRFHLEDSVRLIEQDCFEIDAGALGSFDVYLYDGVHKRESHYMAIERFAASLAPLAVVIVDDWNWERVRDGTNRALRDLDIPVLYRKEIILPEEDVKGMRNHNGRHSWWNGSCIMLLGRPEQDLRVERPPVEKLEETLEETIVRELLSVPAVDVPRELTHWLANRFVVDIRDHQPQLRDVTAHSGWSKHAEAHPDWRFLVETALRRIRDRRIDCSFQVSFGDCNGGQGAPHADGARWIFVSSRRQSTCCPLFPNFVHASNLRSGHYAELREKASGESFASRRSGILWRGSMTNPIRARLVQLADKTDHVDARFGRIKNDHERNQAEAAGIGGALLETDFIPPKDYFTKHQTVIVVDGYAAAFRLPAHFCAGQCVLLATRHEEWFYRYMKPWEHFIPLEPDLSNLPEITAWVVENPDAVEEIALNGRKFFDQWLDLGGTTAYVAGLLRVLDRLGDD